MSIVDAHGYIVNAKVRRAYAHICESNGRGDGGRAAEAFLRLVLRIPDRAIPLIGEHKDERLYDNR